MGSFKISQHTDIFTSCAFLVFLVTDTIFIFELLFENCFWTVELRESMGRGVRLVLLLLAITSFVFALYMVFTPLRSDSNRLDEENSKGPDMQIFTWGMKKDQLELSEGREENFSSQTTDGKEKVCIKEIMSIESLENQSYSLFAEFSLDHPKTVIHSECESQKPAPVLAPNRDCINESFHLEELNSMVNMVSTSEVISKGTAQNYETEVSRENVEVGVGVHRQKGGEDGACEPVKSSSASISDVPGSCKNTTVKGGNVRNDDKKAALSGLGRAGRRQLAAILDEFWAHLFDLHGRLTEEAKVIRTDLLLNLDLEMYCASARAGTRDETSQKSSSDTESGPPPSANLSNYTPMQEKAMKLGLSYVPLAQTSFWSVDTQFLDVNGQCDGQDCHIPQIHNFEIPQFGTWLLTPNFAKSSVTEYRDRLKDTSSQNASGSLCKSSLQNPASTGSIYSQFKRPQYEPSSVKSPSFLGSTKENSGFPDILELTDSFGCLSLNISGSFSSASGTAHDQPQNPNNLISEVEEASSAALDKLSVSKHHKSFLCQVVSPILDSEPFWVQQPLENMFSSAFKASEVRKRKQVMNTPFTSKIIMSYGESEAFFLHCLRVCLGKLLDLEGSSWLFTQNGGYDEKLIDRVAAAEGYLRKEGTSSLNEVKCSEEADMNDVISSFPNCGDHCTWQSGLVTSFGVWCICRILELLLVESRPELWGKYTYVLNRLQVKIATLSFSFYKKNTRKLSQTLLVL